MVSTNGNTIKHKLGCRIEKEGVQDESNPVFTNGNTIKYKLGCRIEKEVVQDDSNPPGALADSTLSNHYYGLEALSISSSYQDLDLPKASQ